MLRALFLPLSLLLLYVYGSAWVLGQPAQAKNTVLYLGDFGVPETLDPVTATTPVEHHLCQFLFDSLVIPDKDGDFSFSLAKEVDISPDGLGYTFILHKELFWSDGTPLTARDVEFTLRVLLNKDTDNYTGTLAKYIEDVSCIHPQAITVFLSRPFYNPLALFTFKILPKHKFDSDILKRSHPFTKNPIGCGPFVLQKQGLKGISLTRNPFFKHRQPPFLQKILVKFYQNKAEAVRDLAAQKLHMLTDIHPQSLPLLEKHKNQFVVHKYRTPTIYFIAFNHRPEHRYHHLFSDYRFRRALLYALDRGTILSKTFYAGIDKSEALAGLISGPFPLNSWAYNEKLAPFPYNNSDAEQLLKELLTRKGYQQNAQQSWTKEQEGRLELTLRYNSGDLASASICTQIAEAWKRLGIQISLVELDEKKWSQQVLEEHQFDLAYTQYTFDNTLDIFPLFDPQRIDKGQSNFSGFVDSKLVELFYQLQNTLNPWVLRSISHKIHQQVYEDTVHLFLWQLEHYAAYHRSVKNVKVHPDYLVNFPEKWKIVQE